MTAPKPCRLPMGHCWHLGVANSSMWWDCCCCGQTTTQEPPNPKTNLNLHPPR